MGRAFKKLPLAFALTAVLAVGCNRVSPTPETEKDPTVDATKYISVENDTLSLRDISEEIGSVESVKIDGKTIPFTDNGNGTVTFSENVAGEKTLTVVADTGEYGYEGILADYLIHDYESMKYYFAEARLDVKYAVLTADVKGLGGRESLACHQYPPEGATLNGLGHTFDSVYFIRGLFGGKEETVRNFTLKNVAFTNMLTWGWSSLAYSLENSVWENVKMEISVDDSSRMPYGDDGFGLLGWQFADVTLKNCDFTFHIPNELMGYAIRLLGNESGNSVRLIESKIQSDGFIAVNGETDTGHNAVTQKDAFVLDEHSSIADERIIVALDENGHVLLRESEDLRLEAGVSVTSVTVGKLLSSGGGTIRIAGIAADSQTVLKLTLSNKTEKYIYLQVLPAKNG